MLEIIFYILIIVGAVAALAYTSAGMLGVGIAFGILALAALLFVGILALPHRR